MSELDFKSFTGSEEMNETISEETDVPKDHSNLTINENGEITPIEEAPE